MENYEAIEEGLWNTEEKLDAKTKEVFNQDKVKDIWEQVNKLKTQIFELDVKIGVLWTEILKWQKDEKSEELLWGVDDDLFDSVEHSVN